MKLVFVLNQDGSPLMPCKPAKARKLLRDGKAKVARRNPFTIRLNWQCEGSTQPVKLGIDKGSHHTGFCAVANGRVLITGKISHRKDIKEKMDARREHRRSRRSRKWYRPARFDNRDSMKRSGRLPPSIRANVEEVYRVLWEKRVWSIYSTGSLAFPRVKGEPTSSVPKHCRLLERAKTVMFEMAD